MTPGDIPLQYFKAIFANDASSQEKISSLRQCTGTRLGDEPNIKNRQEILSLLQALPQAPSVYLQEILFFIEQNQLHGKGIGLVDIHLLASAKLGQVLLWTADRRLKAAVVELSIDYIRKK